MGKRVFQSAKEAFTFAKELAMRNKVIVKPFRLNEIWVIEGDNVEEDIDYSTIYTELVSHIKGELSSNEDVIDLVEIFEEKLKVVDLTINNKSTLDNENKNYLTEIYKIYESLVRLSEYIKDIAKVKSKEYALDMAYEFNQIADELLGYKVSNLARRYKMEMIQLSSKLEPELNVSKDVEKSKVISRLEAIKGKCGKSNCDGKWVIRESTHGYFWGCNLFPKCFSRKYLTKEEIDLLD
jgi:hypothetical protein